jgi:hypothetical protein
MNFLKRPLVLTLQFAVVVLAFAVLVAKMGWWWGPLVTNYPSVDDRVMNAVLKVLGAEGAQLNSLRNMLIVGFVVVSFVLFALLYCVIILFNQNRKLERWVGNIDVRLNNSEMSERQKVLPALRSLLKMLEVIKPQGSQEFAGHLAQVMSLVGQIRRVAKPEIVIADVSEETGEIDQILERITQLESDLQTAQQQLRELDGKTDGNAAAIGEIQETLEITGVNAEAAEKRAEASKDAAAKPAVTPTPSAPAAS